MLVGKKISVTYFLNLIKWDVLAIVGYAGMVGTLDHYSFLKAISIPLAVSALIGTLVSLILAFRTAQSYERWWEARIVWGAIVNDSRTLIRQLINFLPANENKEKWLQDFAIRQSIWCFSLADSLRKLPLSPHVANYVAVQGLKNNHIANQLLTKHVEQISQLSVDYQIDPIKQTQLDSTLARLTDSMGKCERIKNTVFPRPYSVLIHFLIYVLMTILPFGLDDSYALIEFCVVVLIPVLLIAIEKTAIIMQDPFEQRPTDTPMTNLSITIEKNLMEMVNLPDQGRTSGLDDDYYVM